MNRRSFFTATACLGAAAAFGAESQQRSPAHAVGKKRIKLGLCTYSYWTTNTIPNDPQHV